MEYIKPILNNFNINYEICIKILWKMENVSFASITGIYKYKGQTRARVFSL